ncbi:MAG: UPF0489 family protein [Sporocytophaga sp.]|nr:UPF0489 family protein [Sporocytophaga sp.]
MNIQKINEKEIFICESHNEVIQFWARYKSSKPNILSFDHHTDTRRAFQSEWISKKLDSNQDLINKLKDGDFELVKNLKHDEHIDAAIRCEFVDKVLILSYDSSKSRIEDLINVDDRENYKDNTRIIVNCHSSQPEMSIESDILSEKIKRFELCLKPIEWNTNYILDIDLDFFYQKKSIEVSDKSFFSNLIKNAKAISIARERGWINQWKKEFDSELTVDFLEEKLIKLIEQST